MKQDYLKAVLDYDSQTGKFIWKVRPSNHFKSYRAERMYVGKFQGKEAGCIQTDRGGLQYLTIRIDGKLYFAHRLAWFYTYGVWPDVTDHIDGDGLNNSIINLRNVDKIVNGKNSRLSKNNKSGINGVRWYDKSSKWIVEGSYTENGKQVKVHLGSFSNQEDARKARDNWQISNNFTRRHGLNESV